MNSTTNESNLSALTVRGLQGRLTESGLDLSYETLSKFINAGDVAEQLQISGGKNGRQIPPDAAVVLTAFWPRYKEKRGTLPQAPDMLRAFLSAAPDASALAPVRQYAITGEAASTAALSAVREFASTGELATLAQQIGREAGRWHKPILNATEAARLLGVSIPTLRQHVAPYRRFGQTQRGDRWLLKDLMKTAE